MNRCHGHPTQLYIRLVLDRHPSMDFNRMPLIRRYWQRGALTP